MRLHHIIIASVAAGFAVGVFAAVSPAAAQDGPRMERLADLRDRCEQDDRRACVRFGMILGQMSDRLRDLRSTNPELFWWERQGDRNDSDRE
jgi:hypothetical protein